MLDYLLQIIPTIADGLKVTVSRCCIVWILSIPGGILMAMLRLSKLPLVDKFVDAFVYLMRGTPLMLQILFVYYALPIITDGAIQMDDATAAGRGYAVAGGVADAIVNCVHELYPDKEIKVDRAEGLRDCKKMLMLAKAGKRNGYLLEGMACPGGCIAGAGTILPINKAAQAVKKFQGEAEGTVALQNKKLADLENIDLD